MGMRTLPEYASALASRQAAFESIDKALFPQVMPTTLSILA